MTRSTRQAAEDERDAAAGGMNREGPADEDFRRLLGRSTWRCPDRYGFMNGATSWLRMFDVPCAVNNVKKR